ncbi:polysaccharide deacetylase family protein [Empedobacter brevis]|uniref:polysaccharide deacetylase family protein n=1 Tax=Empedobacter brevis TaxID=247 RepID=UPI00039AEA24|nr:polysaccharide deacetylase family protein [Empedobacter brevis]
MKYFRFLLIIYFYLYLISCTDQEDNTLNKIKDADQGGVVLTFDDDYVDEWFNVNIKLKQYNWKGTFYITHFNKLSENQIQELNYLQRNGNEIAAHGLSHVHTVKFIKQFGQKVFISKQVLPMLDLMKKKGLKITDFSYPYGERNIESDTLLFEHFKMLRGTTYGKEPPQFQNCYYENKSLIFGLGLDNSYSHFDIPYFISLLQYAKEHNKIVIFYAHKTVLKSNNKYETEFKTLEEVCKFVKNNKMKFYTVADLQKLNNQKTLN